MMCEERKCNGSERSFSSTNRSCGKHTLLTRLFFFRPRHTSSPYLTAMIKTNETYGRPDESDASSLCNARDVQVVHSKIVWKIDFEKKILTGHVDVRAKILADGASALVLDTNHLNIFDVENQKWRLGENVGSFGRPLHIVIPEKSRKEGSTFHVRIAYETTSTCSAIQWLPPEQTAGKKHPFMFTQCQAIHARSLLPCQDTPGAKMTYTCEVTVPERELTALMSAKGNGDAPSGRTFKFEQPIPVSSYLIALAVGELKFSSCSERCGVWAEPSVVKKAAWEFGEVERMVAAGERVCGPYRWGRYDVLCMPPSFPYGGMENPCLTFVTPTLLAGDRSLADVRFCFLFIVIVSRLLLHGPNRSFFISIVRSPSRL